MKSILPPGDGSLVVFSSLVIAGAGTTAAITLLPASVPIPDVVRWTSILAWCAGLAVSTRHVGHPRRVGGAVRGIGRSPISNEALLGGIGLALAVVDAAMGDRVAAAGVVHLATGIGAVLFLLSIGRVYTLPGQLTWNGVSIVAPLSAGLAVGALLVAGLPGAPPVSTITISVLAADTFVHFQRWRRVADVSLELGPAAGPTFEHRHEWMAARLLLVDALPCISLFVWPTALAATIALAGLVIDRVAFYGLAVQRTPEREAARVSAQVGD